MNTEDQIPNKEDGNKKERIVHVDSVEIQALIDLVKELVEETSKTGEDKKYKMCDIADIFWPKVKVIVKSEGVFVDEYKIFGLLVIKYANLFRIYGENNPIEFNYHSIEGSINSIIGNNSVVGEVKKVLTTSPIVQQYKEKWNEIYRKLKGDTLVNYKREELEEVTGD